MRPLPAGGSGAHGALWALLTNPTLLPAGLACGAAQLAKPLLAAHKAGGSGGPIEWRLALTPGGMPSSHTAAVFGLSTAIALTEGAGSALFAIALVLALVVSYDATGVRLHAGRHASALNVIIAQLPGDHPAADTASFTETLGHTPAQVAAGAGLGVGVALLCAALSSLAGGRGGGGLVPAG